MEFIGKHLKSKRTEKKISLKKISKELMISENLLKDIESDDFPKYLSTVYLIGHIRSYSKFLNLDDNLVVENFKIQVSYNRINVSKEISKPIKSIKYIFILWNNVFCLYHHYFNWHIFYFYPT